MAHNQQPVRHLVVLGHPAPGSFNHQLADTWCETIASCGQEVELRDLYALGFDPLLKAGERPSSRGFTPGPDVAMELEALRGVQALTLVYPIWFGMPPAIIKGYVDRVLGAGFSARDIKAGVPHPALHGKHLMILTTSGTTLPWLEAQGQWASLCQGFDTYLTTIFSLAGHEHLHFDSIVEDVRPHYLAECLEDTRQRARRFCAARFAEAHRRVLHSEAV